MRFLEKKTFPFKIFKSSSNKYVTNHMVFSLEKKNAENESRKERKENSNEFMQKSEAEQKKCSASLIYRTSFKYFVSLSLHRNHPQPEMRFVFFIVVCWDTFNTHASKESERDVLFFALWPWFHRFFLLSLCFALRCDGTISFYLSSPTDSIYSLSFDIIYFTNSNLCNTRRQNIEREWMCHRKKSNLSFTVQ